MSRRNIGMKKKSENATVIPFPGLVDRLTDKGMDALLNKRYMEAAELLSQAVSLEEEQYNAKFGLVVALVELGKYKEAKEHSLSLLKSGQGDFFKTMELHVMILLQLNEYEEMQSSINALLEEGLVPLDKEEHFSNLLEFSQRMAEDQLVEQVHEEEEQEMLVLDLFSKTDEEQLLVVSKLKNENIRRYIDEIKDYLQSPEGHPFVKTVLLLLLKEQEYNGECDVEKFLKHITVVPSALSEVNENDLFIETLSILEKTIAHDNPTLFELTKQLLERHHFLLFPVEPKETATSWAAAHHVLGNIYQGFEGNDEEIALLYDIELNKVKEILNYIQHIEEISSI